MVLCGRSDSVVTYLYRFHMEKEKNYLIVGTGERLARLVPESPSSMQKDLAHGHASEIQGILFDMIALGDRLGVEMPTYRRVAGKFRG